MDWPGQQAQQWPGAPAGGENPPQDDSILGKAGKVWEGADQPVEGGLSLPVIGQPSFLGMAKSIWNAARRPSEALNLPPLPPEPTREEDYPDWIQAVNERNEKLRQYGQEMSVFSPLARSALPVRPNAPAGSGPIRDITRGITNPELVAGQQLRNAAVDPEKVISTPSREIIPGSEPTLFQESGDIGLGQLEAGYKQGNIEFDQRKQAQNAAQLEALQDVQRTGSPEALRDHLNTNLFQIESESKRANDIARYNAFHQARQLGAETDPEIHGQVLRHELNVAERGVRQRENDLWNAIDPDGRFVVSPDPVRGAWDNIYGGLTEAERGTITPEERALGTLLDGYGPDVPFREMDGFRKRVGWEMDAEYNRNGRSPAYNRLSRLNGGVHDAIVDHVVDTRADEFTREAADRLAAARAASSQRAQTFGIDPIKKILRQNGVARTYSMGDASVPGAIWRAGPQGYETVSSFLRATRNALPQLRDAAIEAMRRYAMEEDGTINPDRLNTWMGNHSDALRAITEHDGGNFAQSLSNVQNASRSMGEVAATRRMVEDTAKQGIFGRLIGAEDPREISRIIGGIFGSDRAIATARQLRGRIGSNQEALDGARRAIVDYVWDRYVTGRPDAGVSGLPKMGTGEFKKFVEKNQGALGQFFDEPQLKQWQAIVDDIDRTGLSNNALRAHQSDSARNFAAMAKAGQSPWRGAGTVFRYGLWAAAAATGGGWLAHWLGAAGAAGIALLGNYMRDAGITNVQSIAKEGLLNPEFGKELMRKAGGSYESTWRMPNSFKNVMGRISMYEAQQDIGRRTRINVGNPQLPTVDKGQ